MPNSQKRTTNKKKSKITTHKSSSFHHHLHKRAPHGPHHVLFYIILFFVVFGVTFTIFSNFQWAKQNQSYMQKNLEEIYTGKTPCADCPGINTTLTLNRNEYENPTTYTLTLEYQDRDITSTESGTWTLSTWKNKPLITLTSFENAQKTYYEVIGENKIRQLDGDKNPIPESMPFTLTKK